SGYAYILSGEGNYIAHSLDNSKLGSSFSEENIKTEDILNTVARNETKFFEGKHINNEDAFKVHVPLKVEGIDSYWSGAFVVNKSEAMKSAYHIVWDTVMIALAGLILLAFVSFLLLKRSLRPISKIVGFVAELGKGNLNVDISVDSDDELGEMTTQLRQTTKIIKSYIQEISDVVGEMSKGNFEISLKQEYIGDFLSIEQSLNTVIDMLNDMFLKIGTSANQISSGANEVSNGAVNLSQGATEQASAIQELSASISDVAHKIRTIAESAESANGKASLIGERLQKSKNKMKGLINAINVINDTSDKIKNINKAIEDIAFQTNILALNASVEAARAGNAGKGFSVVANEIRSLAAKSREASKNTTQLIGTSMKAVQNGKRIADDTANSLADVIDGSQEIIDFIREISSSTNEQSQAISQINTGIEQISAVTQTNAATAEESAAASEELSAQTVLLDELLSKLKYRQ
ncbi:MAG: methyl-accepting chemotaxis protein, partial [Clostridia bacterium]|nr:methyl-accepting chemotaxis protein [Clostridia bacterium]